MPTRFDRMSDADAAAGQVLAASADGVRSPGGGDARRSQFDHGAGVEQDRLTLRLTNRITEISRGAALVEAFCARQGLPPTLAFAINVALEELLGNTMAYGYDDDRVHEIGVQIWRQDADLAIEIADDARPFDPTQVTPPDLTASLEQRPIGGLGIQLVRNMVDRMDYWHDGQRNHVRLRKRIVPA